MAPPKKTRAQVLATALGERTANLVFTGSGLETANTEITNLEYALATARELAIAYRAEAAEAPTTYDKSGVFSNFVGATPKYARGPRDANYRDTMARLYIVGQKGTQEPAHVDRSKLVQAVSPDGTRERDLAKKAVRGVVNKDGATTNDSDGPGYIEFILQSATHNYVEKIDVVETLADRYVAYAFGNAPPSFSYNVALLNNKQDDQAANMFRIYWNMLRAYAGARVKAEVYLEYDGMIIAGTMTNFSWTLVAQDESYCQGNFTLLARKLLLMPNDSYDNHNSKAESSPMQSGDAQRKQLYQAVEPGTTYPTLTYTPTT